MEHSSALVSESHGLDGLRSIEAELNAREEQSAIAQHETAVPNALRLTIAQHETAIVCHWQ